MAPIASQFSITLPTTLLANGAVFTSAWFDSTQIPVNYVELASYSDQASAAAGVVIQESDDTTNANFTRTAGSDTAGAATLESMIVPIRKRYWRIVYTNGGVTQTAFELTVGLLSEVPAQIDNSGNLISPQQSSGWTVTSQPATGTVASAVQAATLGKRHICTGLMFTWGAIAAPVATLLVVTVLDGAAIIWTGVVAIPAAVASGQVSITGLNLQGTSNTSMTAQFSAGLANLNEAASMQGYDLQ
jgi:hypothetical protein